MTTTIASPDVPGLDRFLEDGFCRIDDAIDENELGRLGELYDDCFSEDRDRGVRRKALGGTDDQGREALPQVLGPTQQFPELVGMTYYQRMRDVASRVFGEEVGTSNSHMILKPAGYGAPTPWHQDQAYHDPGFRYRKINFWLPMDGATVEGGCMHYVRGSHLGPVLPHEYLIPGDEQSAMVAQDQAYWSLNGTAVPCPRGSVCLHHSYCMHYAGPNTTDQSRRAYILVFGVGATKLDPAWVFPWRSNWSG